MPRLIDADAMREDWLENGENEYVYDTNAFLESIDEQPTIEAVPKSYVDQIRWERDIAIEQLNEIGCSFGQKMDDVKRRLEAVPVVHGGWAAQDEGLTKFMCSICKGKNYGGHEKFCPNCGADMRKKA